MNTKPNIPDYQHQANVELRETLERQGFKFEITSQGYRVEDNGHFIAAAGTLQKPHGRYREANLRDNLESALHHAMRYCGEKATEK